jgi:hypothetical protein
MNWSLPQLWPNGRRRSGGEEEAPAGLVGSAPEHGIWLGTIGPSSWVGALSAYNEGSLHGAWLDLVRIETGEAWEAAQTHLLATSPEGGELRTRVLDATGLGRHLGQTPAAEDVVAIGRVARELSEEALPAFEAWIRISGWNPHEQAAAAAVEGFRGEYLGSHASIEAWAWEQLRDSGLLGPVPPELHPFLDALGWARSRLPGELVAGDLEGDGGRVAIFRRR